LKTQFWIIFVEIYNFQSSITHQQGILFNQTKLQMRGVYIEKKGLYWVWLKRRLCWWVMDDSKCHFAHCLYQIIHQLGHDRTTIVPLLGYDWHPIGTQLAIIHD